MNTNKIIDLSCMSPLSTALIPCRGMEFKESCLYHISFIYLLPFENGNFLKDAEFSERYRSLSNIYVAPFFEKLKLMF